MKYRIHGIGLNGSEDEILIEADNIEDLQKLVKEEVSKRQWKSCWSEEQHNAEG